ncbi:hypothetical protein MUP77_11100, partial [Candidatus Bathyarchaeota archaeon]|nr:hypothetical protein [Candidatus Bathyarchaeota archaeon]
MPSLDPDQAFENFKRIAQIFQNAKLSEMDTRAKVIDPIFKDCLGWEDSDRERNEHVHKGFLDYTFNIKGKPIFVLEAKKTGIYFTIPLALKKKRYKISGSISTDSKIREAIDQAHKYSIEVGTEFAAVSNGEQLILFKTFKRGGKWRDGLCLVFKSFEDILSNFSFFFNVLSKDAVCSGSLKEHVSEEIVAPIFKRPLDGIHDENAICGKNLLAERLNPIIQYIFKDITDDSQVEVLEKCYVRQKQMASTDRILKSSFDKLPYYAKHYDIGWFKESALESGEFQLSFEKCCKFLREEAPAGSLIMLLGGVGSGKTTFVHHFFKIVMHDQEDILWFYVDFGVSPPEKE